MRFAKILLVCFGLVLLAGLRVNCSSVRAGTANPALVVDGGEPFPTPPSFADGGEPFPPTPPQASLVADGGEPFPTPPSFADGSETFPPTLTQVSLELKAAA